MNIDYPKDNINELKKLWNEAFGDGDEFLNMFYTKIYSPKKCRVAFEGGEIASALYLFDTECFGKKYAYIYAVATLKKFRGRGICQKLMANTHNLLKNEGYAGAILVPGSESLFDFYRKMGYKTTCSINKFTTFASDNETAVRKVDKAEFAAVRKKLLPYGGIIQENKSIDFLSELYGLYSGKDFVMAANVKDGKLNCAEFLGNKNLCPDILKTLGCSKGIFRTPGDDFPFAMYLSFENNESAVPRYFGIAFD